MRLYQVIGNILKVDPTTLSETSNAENTQNWDSLRHIEVIFAVEAAFHVRFEMSEITSLRNLGDIRTLLLNRGVDINEEIEVKKAV